MLNENTVAKFGGTSLATGPALAAVTEIINTIRPAWVVPSAPGRQESDHVKVTDWLIRAFNDDSAAWQRVRERFLELCVGDAEHDTMSGWLAEISTQLHSCSQAWLVSRGEYLMARLLALRLNRRFVDAASVIRFRCDADGELDFEETRRLLRKLPPDTVIPGFYGALADGNVITFTRGGSDITAALIAAAHGATFMKWTDTDGIYSDDPHSDRECIHLPKISYDGLRLTSRNAVNPWAVNVCEEAGVPIIVCSTWQPEGRSTRISAAT